MIARAGSGWQTTLADLSLILFMVMAAVVRAAPATPANSALPASPAPSPRGEPVAVWRAGKGAPALAQWLVAADPRAALTITVRYGAHGPDAAPGTALTAALDRARVLARDAGTYGATARIVIEPGEGEQAVVAYDAPALARGLQNTGQSVPTEISVPTGSSR